MPPKDKQKRNEYNRAYRERNREQTRLQQRGYYAKNRKARLENTRKWKAKLREELKQELGDKCRICGRRRERYFYHEIHGKNHVRSNPNYILQHKEDFVPLCGLCHRDLHHIAKYWKTAKRYLELLTHKVKENKEEKK